MSLQARWRDGDNDYQVVAPVSLIISAFAPVTDVRRQLTPQLKQTLQPGHLLLVDLGEGANRIGGSALTQVFNRSGGKAPNVDNPQALKNFFAAIQALSEQGLLLAYHDRSDGGVFASVAEMMFAIRMGASLRFAG